MVGTFTLKKLQCSKQARRLNNGAWNNGIGPRSYFAGFPDCGVLEVKFLDHRKMIDCESICQACFH